jgi:hypothetical protein
MIVMVTNLLVEAGWKKSSWLVRDKIKKKNLHHQVLQVDLILVVVVLNKAQNLIVEMEVYLMIMTQKDPQVQMVKMLWIVLLQEMKLLKKAKIVYQQQIPVIVYVHLVDAKEWTNCDQIYEYK